ncbi:hypothetical protein [Phenylobacterium aquaticum]|uniref:hypothetical protein n=1 Tax=Phenylobacterium aquaticum TaxID=1763816 RepID=UPI001F5DDF27|nr:hypothetical protein [Phenylobacterium aquaticum]MCI3134313.1 hypothetical protein [Phenylobacterium aquaticum]
MRQIYETPDGRIRIVGRAELGTGEAEAIAGRVQAAYDWVARTQAWPDAAPLSAPLQVTVAETPGVLGVAMKDRFKVGLAYLRSDPVLSAGTLAHELTHIQDRREVRPSGVPGFIAEGRGLTDGFMYRRSLGYPPQPYDRSLARAIAGYTAADAAAVLDDLSPGDLADPAANRRLEFIGAWFVEFLRTRCGGAGFVDVQPRLARVITEMRGGADFGAAFKDVFGLDWDATRTAFVAEARQTRGAERLKGTIWQGLAEAPHSKTP